MKYKVGDKVRVKPLNWFKENCLWIEIYGYFTNEVGGIPFTIPMQRFCGQTVMIYKIDDTEPLYTVKADGYRWYFAEWMFEEKENKNMYIIIDKEDMGLVTKGVDFKDCFFNTLCEAEVEAQKYAKDMGVSVDKLCVLSMTDSTDVYEFKSSLSHAYELSAIKD